MTNIRANISRKKLVDSEPFCKSYEHFSEISLRVSFSKISENYIQTIFTNPRANPSKYPVSIYGSVQL